MPKNPLPPIQPPQPPAKTPFIAQLLLGAIFLPFFLIGSAATIGAIVAQGPGFIFLAIFFFIIAAVGLYIPIRQTKRGPGFWLGFLISIGLALLAFGVCSLGNRINEHLKAIPRL
jgi:hypothetical protein